MKIHEKNLKQIIEYIEKFGAIKDIKISNSSFIISPGYSRDKQPCQSKVIEIDLNRAKEFEIKFVMGDEKREH